MIIGVGPTTFRALMSTFPSGVAIVTTSETDGAPRGLTCSSLCSVSLEPPLLLVCIGNGSGTLAAIQDRGVFALNLLHHGGREAAELFASGRPDRFQRIEWRPTPNLALPCLAAHAHAAAECAVRRCVTMGDHTVVIAEVLDVEWLGPAEPLLYGLRTYAEWPPA
jgi:flavin reductase (DIM6/NTAB) family NADH-FMN oxidoreductase RutF